MELFILGTLFGAGLLQAYKSTQRTLLLRKIRKQHAFDTAVKEAIANVTNANNASNSTQVDSDGWPYGWDSCGCHESWEDHDKWAELLLKKQTHS